MCALGTQKIKQPRTGLNNVCPVCNAGTKRYNTGTPNNYKDNHPSKGEHISSPFFISPSSRILSILLRILPILLRILPILLRILPILLRILSILLRILPILLRILPILLRILSILLRILLILLRILPILLRILPIITVILKKNIKKLTNHTPKPTFFAFI